MVISFKMQFTALNKLQNHVDRKQVAKS